MAAVFNVTAIGNGANSFVMQSDFAWNLERLAYSSVNISRSRHLAESSSVNIRRSRHLAESSSVNISRSRHLAGSSSVNIRRSRHLALGL